MSVSLKLKEFLEREGAAFEHHVHPTTYTSQRTAETLHVPGQEMAKATVIHADGVLLLAVLPADRKVDLHHLQFMTRAQEIRLATETEFAEAFPSCEPGAVPPFGNLFGLPTYCDKSWEGRGGSIEFNAGSHNDTMRMSFDVYRRLARPIFLDLVQHSPVQAA